MANKAVDPYYARSDIHPSSYYVPSDVATEVGSDDQGYDPDESSGYDSSDSAEQSLTSDAEEHDEASQQTLKDNASDSGRSELSNAASGYDDPKAMMLAFMDRVGLDPESKAAKNVWEFVKYASEQHHEKEDELNRLRKICEAAAECADNKVCSRQCCHELFGYGLKHDVQAMQRLKIENGELDREKAALEAAVEEKDGQFDYLADVILDLQKEVKKQTKTIKQQSKHADDLEQTITRIDGDLHCAKVDGKKYTDLLQQAGEQHDTLFKNFKLILERRKEQEAVISDMQADIADWQANHEAMKRLLERSEKQTNEMHRAFHHYYHLYEKTQEFDPLPEFDYICCGPNECTNDDCFCRNEGCSCQSRANKAEAARRAVEAIWGFEDELPHDLRPCQRWMGAEECRDWDCWCQSTAEETTLDLAPTDIDLGAQSDNIMTDEPGLRFPYNVCCDMFCRHAREAGGLTFKVLVERKCCSAYRPHAHEATAEERQGLLASQRLDGARIRRIAAQPAQNGWINEHIENV